MAVFNVELKKVVDDSYEIEIGFGLADKLIADIQNGLVGSIIKFAVITDSVVKDLYADEILTKLQNAGYHADLFVFEAGEKQKTRKTKELIEDLCRRKKLSRSHGLVYTECRMGCPRV